MTSYRVLVVDELKATRHTLERSLGRAGHRVVSTGSGEEACEILAAEELDVVLMDLHMCTMSGRTLYQLILAQWPYVAKRLAVMSGTPADDAHAEWLALYDLPIVAKPLRLDELGRIVNHLGARRALPAHGA